MTNKDRLLITMMQWISPAYFKTLAGLFASVKMANQYLEYAHLQQAKLNVFMVNHRITKLKDQTTAASDLLKHPVLVDYLGYIISVTLEKERYNELKLQQHIDKTHPNEWTPQDKEDVLLLMMKYGFEHKDYDNEKIVEVLDVLYQPQAPVSQPVPEKTVVYQPKSPKKDLQKITKVLDRYDQQLKAISTDLPTMSLKADSALLMRKFQLEDFVYQLNQEPQEIVNTQRAKIMQEHVHHLQTNYFHLVAAYPSPYQQESSGYRSVKVTFTPQEHVSLLTHRNLYIEDLDQACKIIARRGYYRLTGYLKQINRYDDYRNHTFGELIDYYDMDMKMRAAMIPLLERIEVTFKYTFANWFTNKYEKNYTEDQTRAHTNPLFFNNEYEHQQLMKRLGETISYGIRDKNDIIEKYYDNNYQDIPLWCLCEICTFIWFINLFQALSTSDQQEYIDQHYENLDYKTFNNLITKINFLRNSVAHHNILFKRELKPMLQFEDKSDLDIRINNNSLYAYLINIIRLIDEEEVVRDFVNTLKKIEDKHTKNNTSHIKTAYGIITGYNTALIREMGKFVRG